jgi:chromosome segregation protein
VFLKALTIKGFKSFAETANLDLEPGITVVVGPNGSGKSNVVDAMAWVLGAQAPTSVRSQKMDDVIFAGTASRKALGRAEVSLTIDNEDGELPIELSEVTITRTLFRSGDSDYAINGASCRLLDIQELLSDSGVGRQQHIIVSQGRIDDVLNAKPEDRRAIIEEAAGVLKFRKRKERAERRLAATEENLHRLQDLLREVKRQLRPLEKQANAARRHGALVEELTALKIHLAGRELASLTQQLQGAAKQRLETHEREDIINSTLATLDAAVLEGEAELAALGGSDITDVASRARSLRERIRGQNNVVAERRRRLEGELQTAVDDGLVANLEAESARLAGELRVAESDARALQPEFAHLEETEARLSNEQLTFDTEWDDELAPKPTRAPEMRAQLEALASAASRSGATIAGLNTELEAVEARRAAAANDRNAAAASIAKLERELPLAEQTLAAAEEAVIRTDRLLAERADTRRDADAEASRWTARHDALAQALDDARSRAGADALDDAAGVLGALLDLVAIDDGWEAAVEAAAGEALQAVVIDSPANAAAALAALEDRDLTGAVLALGTAGSSEAATTTDPKPEPAPSPKPNAARAVAAGRPPLGASLYVSPPALDLTSPEPSPSAPAASRAGARAERPGQPLRRRVSARSAELDPLLDRLFGDVRVVDGRWRDGIDEAMSYPDVVVVTKDGDRFGPGGWRIGRAGSGATGAALAEAEENAAIAIETAERAAADFVSVEREAKAAIVASREREDELRRTKTELAQLNQANERSSLQLAQLEEDRQRLDGQRREAVQQQAADRAVADSLRAELPAIENEEAEYLNRVEALSLSRTSLEERARSVSDARKELEVRAASIAQRRELLVSRQTETESRLERLVVERDKARVRREAIEGSIAEVDDLTERLATKVTQVDGWIELLDAEQRVQSEAARRVSAELTARRNERQTAERELGEVRERRNRIELGETENRVKLEAVTEALRRELDTEPDVAMATELPPIGGASNAQVDGDAATEMTRIPDGDRAETGPTPTPRGRVRELERELKVMGPINPLALEEFEALKERYEFLDGQLNDVKTARKDLNTLIRSIDDEIVGVFSSAFADVATNFVELFASLFPGGRGGLRLTNPDDLLNCGIEIEAKPSGKNVKKLSLLSGGERSLVALGFLFAVFRSRPSPFYVMDEVEAALDDVNLSRFLALVEEFRKEAQLIIVSHQKRTMEAADVLYGVTMKSGGSSKVVSEKVEGRRTGAPIIDLERESAAAAGG